MVLHIGARKTGTSSIQYFLRDNRERLADLGCLYPKTPGRARHLRLSLFVKSDAELWDSPEWYRQQQSEPARFRRTFRRRLVREIERSGLSRVLLSDEDLLGCSDLALRRLRRFTNSVARSLRLVVYLRRQDEYMVSRYQQGIKLGWVERLGEWAQQEDMSSVYDYDALLRKWRQLLRPAEFVVRRFEPGSFVDGSLFQDFLEAAGVDARAEDLEQVPNRNESLDADSVEFLRLLNLYRVEEQAATPGLIDNRRLVAQLNEASSGPTLTLPDKLLDAFMARWEQSNRRVAHDIMGDASGTLFRTPRKAGNTTTEQRLEPARIDQLVTLLELPDEWRGPLHRLAVREARAR